jgi:hypothetical protein
MTSSRLGTLARCSSILADYEAHQPLPVVADRRPRDSRDVVGCVAEETIGFGRS